MTPFFSKKAKAEMRSRKRRKKNTSSVSSTHEAEDEGTSQSAHSDELENGLKRSAAEMQSPEDESGGSCKKTKLNSDMLTIIVPSNLTSKEAKKFRKDERRKARSNGHTDDKIRFVIEGKEQSQETQDADAAAKKPPKKSFPRINDLLSEHANQKKLEERMTKQNAINDAVPPSEKERYVAIDCEMVGIGTSGAKSALARASAVDWDGNILLDTFVRVPERVTDFRTFVSGVRPKDIHVKNENAMNHSEVREAMEKLLIGKILVGHALKNDLSVLMISHPRSETRDTAKYKPLMRPSGRAGGKMRPRKLRDLVAENVGMEIQKKGSGGHDSVEDARASMELFKCVRVRWEKELAGKTKGGKGG